MLIKSEVEIKALDLSPVAEVIRGGVEVIEQLAAEWRELCAEGPCDEPFYRPEWIAAYMRAFAPEKQLLIITVRVGGRLRAVLPLVAERAWFYGCPVRKLRSAAGMHSGRFDLVHGAGDEGEAVLAIWEWLRTRSDWDLIELQDVPPGGAAEQLLLAAKIDGYPTGLWESLRTPYIPLPGSGGKPAAALSRTDAKFRGNLRRRMRKLEAKGPVRLIRVESADRAALDRFYELERAGWKGEQGTAIACDADTRRFYDEAAGAAAAFGYFSLYVLECGGHPVAIHYGLTHRGRYFVPKLAYDENYKECAPGHLIVHEILRDAVERGLTEFDFLGPWMEWKAEWTSEVRPHAWCYVFRQGLFGRALHATKFRLMHAARQMKRRLGKLNQYRER